MAATWKVILAFVGVFVAGAVFGGFFTARSAGRHWQTLQSGNPPGGPVPVAGTNRNARGGQITPMMLQRMATKLKLTEEQREKIRPIIARADEDMTWLRRENFRNTDRVLDRMHAEIALLLTDEQKAELEVLKHNIKDRLKRAENERRGESPLRKESNLINRAANDAAVNSGRPK